MKKAILSVILAVSMILGTGYLIDSRENIVSYADKTYYPGDVIDTTETKIVIPSGYDNYRYSPILNPNYGMIDITETLYVTDNCGGVDTKYDIKVYIDEDYWNRTKTYTYYNIHHEIEPYELRTGAHSEIVVDSSTYYPLWWQKQYYDGSSESVDYGVLIKIDGQWYLREVYDNEGDFRVTTDPKYIVAGSIEATPCQIILQ